MQGQFLTLTHFISFSSPFTPNGSLATAAVGFPGVSKAISGGRTTTTVEAEAAAANRGAVSDEAEVIPGDRRWRRWRQRRRLLEVYSAAVEIVASPIGRWTEAIKDYELLRKELPGDNESCSFALSARCNHLTKYYMQHNGLQAIARVLVMLNAICPLTQTVSTSTGFGPETSTILVNSFRLKKFKALQMI
ncbi:hypothetical protein M5689_010639 [Euphorbia peplus]|nr:hypothetical protein M5689_010639 [Euphorbia peplus]